MMYEITATYQQNIGQGSHARLLLSKGKFLELAVISTTNLLGYKNLLREVAWLKDV